MTKPFKFTRVQTIIDKCIARFIVVCAGRRLGKSTWAVERILQRASEPGKMIWYVAPTYKQAKSICWAMLVKRLAPLNWVSHRNNIELELTLLNGSTICLKGANNPDSLRGSRVDYMILDEPADIKEDVWTLVLRPMLADTMGGAAFIGTPKGRNWFYKMFQRGKSEDEPDYESFHFTTLEGGNVTPEEVEAARRDMDELSFKQEMEASFINFQGRAYYTFDYEEHVKKLKYDPDGDLILCFDFNTAPGVAAILQEQALFSYHHVVNGRQEVTDIVGTGMIDEVYIPKNSTTVNVTNKIVQLYGRHKGRVFLYGDATGAAGGSAKVTGSDWDIILKILRPVFGARLYNKVPKANPRERTRLNAVNTRFRTTEGYIRMMIDPKCKYAIQDFEGVQLLEGGSGEIDKKKDPVLTHMSDAIGYYIAAAHPIHEIPKSHDFKVPGRY